MSGKKNAGRSQDVEAAKAAGVPRGMFLVLRDSETSVGEAIAVGKTVLDCGGGAEWLEMALDAGFSSQEITVIARAHSPLIDGMNANGYWALQAYPKLIARGVTHDTCMEVAALGEEWRFYLEALEVGASHGDCLEIIEGMARIRDEDGDAHLYLYADLIRSGVSHDQCMEALDGGFGIGEYNEMYGWEGKLGHEWLMARLKGEVAAPDV